ncbi:MAG TPA: glycerophosphodiester phosphodiesterase [Oculatellaceae cyanobacterium]
MIKKLISSCLLSVLLLEMPQMAVAEQNPLIIAHRGASGYRPEHTLAAYELAIDLGADYIEPDLVPTKDGVLVARHENDITGTTDVADHPEFASRKKSKTIDGESRTGWFTEDFTLSELNTLHARERMPKVRQHNTIYNDRYSIPTFQQIIDLVKKKSEQQHRTIGIYPEAKHPTYFAGIGLSTEKPLLEMLNKNGYLDEKSPVFIQCFEPSTLKRFHEQTRIRLIQLVDEEGQPYDLTVKKDTHMCLDMVKPEGLADIAKYAQGIGPNKNLILPRDKSGKILKATSLVADAHKVGLLVHPWTFRNENAFLPSDLRSANGSDADYGDIFAEYKIFFDLGVDGVFSENPDTARQARAGK